MSYPSSGRVPYGGPKVPLTHLERQPPRILHSGTHVKPGATKSNDLPQYQGNDNMAYSSVTNSKRSILKSGSTEDYSVNDNEISVYRRPKSQRVMYYVKQNGDATLNRSYGSDSFLPLLSSTEFQDSSHLSASVNSAYRAAMQIFSTPSFLRSHHRSRSELDNYNYNNNNTELERSGASTKSLRWKDLTTNENLDNEKAAKGLAKLPSLGIESRPFMNKFLCHQFIESLREVRSSEASIPLCITLRYFDELPSPPEADRRKDGSKSHEYVVRASLFDAAYKQFVGRTWSGTPQQASISGQKIKLNYNQNIYLHTALNDEHILLVLEVLHVTHNDHGAAVYHSCGWSFHRLFAQESEMPDLSSTSSAPTVKVSLYNGSPRALIFLEEPIEKCSLLTKVVNCQASFSVRTHRKLSKVTHLIPENVFVGLNDHIPGLADGTRDQKTGMPDTFKRPKSQKPHHCHIDNISLTLKPNIGIFEDELLRQLNVDRSKTEGVRPEDASKIQIEKRYLQMGVHNGWTYIGEPEIVLLQYEGGAKVKKQASFRKGHKRSGSTGSVTGVKEFVHKNRVDLDGMLEDPNLTVVFFLVYECSPQPNPLHKQANFAHPSFNVAIRWGAFCPFSHLGQEHNSLELRDGPDSNPDSLLKDPFPFMSILLCQQANFAHPSFNVAIRWGAFCPFSHLGQEHNNLELRGGPDSNPDSLLVFQSDIETMGSTVELTHLKGGNLSFSLHQGHAAGKENLSHGASSLHSMLSGGTHHSSGRPHSPMSEASGALHEIQPASAYSTHSRPPMAPNSSYPVLSSPVPSQDRRFLTVPGTHDSESDSDNSLHSPRSPRNDAQYSLKSSSASVKLTNKIAKPKDMSFPHMTGGRPTSTTPRGGHPHHAPPHPGMGGSGGGYPIYAQPQNRTGYMPIEIQHMAMETASPSASGRFGMQELQELPFTPVHAPIMAVAPGMHSGQKLSRAAYAKLYTAGFPQILDDRSEAPEVVDPADVLTFVPVKEEADRLQANEIYFQFLAFARCGEMEFSGGKQVSTVFFTYQFYRYPQITTERLLLGKPQGELASDPNALPCLLQQLEKDGSRKKGPPGYQVKYHLDPSYLKPGEGRLFVQHLAEQTLHIDVWDGDSLHLIGSCAVELRHLCRQGREAVQVTYELDVVAAEYIEHENSLYQAGDLTRDGSVRPVDVQTVLKGRLHLRMANVGHPADPRLNRDAKPIPRKARTVITNETGVSSFLGGSLNAINSHTKALTSTKVCKAQHLAETNHELASVLFTKKDKTMKDEKLEMSQDKQRKLARMKAVRKAEDTGAKVVGTFRQEKEERSRDLKTIELYREQSKRDGIMNMLNAAITTEHVISPSLGNTEFFEFVLRNPYNVEHTVIVDVEDPELIPITDPREWRHFKMLNEVYTSVEEGMFNLETKSGKPEIFLRPKEKVHVPFKFLTFKADHSVKPNVPPNSMNDSEKSILKQQPKRLEDPLQTRLVRVNFRTNEGKPIAILAVKVEPQPHVIDQTFRFHHPEQTFMKKSIRMPPMHSMPGIPVGGAGLSQIYVRCSDPNVICDSKKVPVGEPHDIFIKVACGASPQVKRFFVAMYMDSYLSKPLQIWQFYVHAMQRVDVACVEGQTSRFTLILRGTHASRLVQCFSSHPLEMQLHPTDPFMLAANTLQEIHVGVRPQQVGTKFLYINVVDIEYHQLIRSWLVCVNSRVPVISKAFELHLPLGGGKGSNKKITYTNPYPMKKLFYVRTNREDLVQFKDTRLEVAGGETATIGMRFAPCMSPGMTEIMVFINDEDDKNEETFCIKAIYQ